MIVKDILDHNKIISASEIHIKLEECFKMETSTSIDQLVKEMVDADKFHS